MIILGIDPGYAILGYGVINTDGIRSKAIDYGVIETVAHTPFPQRLERLYTCMNELIKLYKPDHVAFEELFFARNTKTALQVAPHAALRCYPHSRRGCRFMSTRPCR